MVCTAKYVKLVGLGVCVGGVCSIYVMWCDLIDVCACVRCVRCMRC